LRSSRPCCGLQEGYFDTDPGTDDALALIAALNSPELDVRAITVVPGNVTAEMGLENALRWCHWRTVAIFPCGLGAASSFQKTHHC